MALISHKGFGQGLALLNELRPKDSDGRFGRFSGEALVTAIHAPSGLGTVTISVLTIRRNIVQRRGKSGILVERNDVIDHDQEGYFFREWMTVCDPDMP
jgi:hypothetical protein